MIENLYQLTLDSLPDGILLMNGQRKAIYFNETFINIWAIPQELIETKDSKKLLDYAINQVADPIPFIDLVEKLYGSHKHSLDEIRFKDGRIILRRSVPFYDDNSENARIWIFTDVTEERKSKIDKLTNIGNRRAFDHDFELFCQEPKPYSALAVVDVDNFKKYNDTYGHVSGDQILIDLGLVFKEFSEHHTNNISAYRYGGEEFALLFKAFSETDITRIIEDIRMTIQAKQWLHEKNAPFYCVTISIGLAYCQSAISPDELFRQADLALYQSKHNGRNQLTQYTLNL